MHATRAGRVESDFQSQVRDAPTVPAWTVNSVGYRIRGWLLTGVRLVSMPSWELFAEQSQAYRDEVLPPGVTKRLAVEAGVTLGWERYVGTEGDILGIDHFGASAPGNVLFEQFGFTVENVLTYARALLG